MLTLYFLWFDLFTKSSADCLFVSMNTPFDSVDIFYFVISSLWWLSKMQQCFGEEIDSRLWQTLDLLCDTLKSILQRLAFEAWEVFLIVIGYFINACISKEDKSDVFYDGEFMYCAY